MTTEKELNGWQRNKAIKRLILAMQSTEVDSIAWHKVHPKKENKRNLLKCRKENNIKGLFIRSSFC